MDQLQEIVPLKLKVRTSFEPMRTTSPVGDAIRELFCAIRNRQGLRMLQRRTGN
jgi:hypothetical protein